MVSELRSTINTMADGEKMKQQKNKQKRPLTPRKMRIVDLLQDNPEGILSYELRDSLGCMNVAHEIRGLRQMGFDIRCVPEPFVTMDGEKSHIGRYILESTGR